MGKRVFYLMIKELILDKKKNMFRYQEKIIRTNPIIKCFMSTFLSYEDMKVIQILWLPPNFIFITAPAVPVVNIE